MGGLDALDGLELPPRTRRILVQGEKCGFRMGTTSACAENTPRPERRKSECWNYLRVRGEYGGVFGGGDDGTELPPRTRRIQLTMYTLRCINGTTSAYAENTTVSAAQRPSPGNYLRVRGEYTIVNTHECKVLELPPRTRRIPLTSPPKMNSQGTTSAYAENTSP